MANTRQRIIRNIDTADWERKREKTKMGDRDHYYSTNYDKEGGGRNENSNTSLPF